MKCDICRQEVGYASTCKPVPLTLHGVKYIPVRFGSEGYWNKAENEEYKPVQSDICGDCGVRFGSFHHTGCSEEGCPICGEAILKGECKCGW